MKAIWQKTARFFRVVCLALRRQWKLAQRVADLEDQHHQLRTENERLKDELRQAEIDELTGLFDKDSFRKALPKFEFDPARGIAIFDLSNLKRLNNSHGHAEGDRMLELAGDCMRRVADRFNEIELLMLEAEDLTPDQLNEIKRQRLIPRRFLFRCGEGDEVAAFVPVNWGWQFVRQVEHEFGEHTFKADNGRFIARLIGGSSDDDKLGGHAAESGDKRDQADTQMNERKKFFNECQEELGYLATRG